MRKRILIFCFAFLGFAIFFGSAEAKVYLPSAVGNYSQWTGGFGDVDEYPIHDSEATYNETSITDNSQSYNLENETATGTINSSIVRVTVTAKYTSGAPSLTLFLRLGASETLGSANALSASYVTYAGDLARPGGESWSISDINSLEAGFKMTGSGTARVTQLYIDVAYKTETNRVKFHILQETSSGLAPTGQIHPQFSFTITDPIDLIQSAFIEIKGVATSGSANVDISIDPSSLDPDSSPRLKTYNVNATGRPVSFRILYDVTDYFKDKDGGNVRASGGWTFYLNIENDSTSSSTINISSGKLNVTYTWIVPPTVVGAYRASGYIISSTFDAQTANGAAFNSIYWKGSLPASTLVRLQLATSNSATGPFDFIGGATCASNGYYEVNPADDPTTPEVAEIGCATAHNNKKYFRYRVELCSTIDCNPSGGSNTPQVDDVIVNWSP